MTPAKFAALVRLKTRTNSDTFDNTDMLILTETRQLEIAQAILKADEDILLIPQTASLVANQREYPQPTDILSRIKRASAQFNGSDWIPLAEIDINRIDAPIVTETNITDLFNSYKVSKGNPNGARFDIIRKSLVIYSGTITAVTAGLKFWVKTWPTVPVNLTEASVDLSVDPSTTTHGIPMALHEIWARGVIIDWKGSREKPIPLNEHELKYEVHLQKAIETLKHGNLDREVIGELPPPSDRGNEGADY